MYGVKTNGFQSVEEVEAYFDGVAAGIGCYAWMRDGTSYVGTTGSTLAEAQNELDATRTVALDRFNAKQIDDQVVEVDEVIEKPAKHHKGKK